MFTSIYFLIFLIVIWAVYLLIPGKMREGYLLLASILFIGYISVKALVAVAVTSALVFCCALLIEKAKKTGKSGKVIAVAGILVFACVLVVVKNIPWAIKFAGGMGLSDDHLLRKLLLPVGFSFYSFQSIGYIYDVYNGKDKAEHNFIRFALYMLFFPKFVSGPIERQGAFGKQLGELREVKLFESSRIWQAVMYILWGYALKMIVADRLALLVNVVHKMPTAFDVSFLIICTIFYSFQVYADFAGYTCIAIGISKLFGLNLMNNFESPYWSATITEFWRRWHISLSSWLRDYVYIPLGGNRQGLLRKYINTMIVFVLCGIWHGNGLSFFVWGALHGIYSVIDRYTLKKCKPVIGRIFTFIMVSFAWIFFRADSTGVAIEYIKTMIRSGFWFESKKGLYISMGESFKQVILGFVFIFILMIIDGIAYKKNKSVPILMSERKPVIKYLIVYIVIMLLFIFGIYGGTYVAADFIYMQF